MLIATQEVLIHLEMLVHADFAVASDSSFANHIVMPLSHRGSLIADRTILLVFHCSQGMRLSSVDLIADQLRQCLYQKDPSTYVDGVSGYKCSMQTMFFTAEISYINREGGRHDVDTVHIESLLE